MLSDGVLVQCNVFGIHSAPPTHPALHTLHTYALSRIAHTITHPLAGVVLSGPLYAAAPQVHCVQLLGIQTTWCQVGARVCGCVCVCI